MMSCLDLADIRLLLESLPVCFFDVELAAWPYYVCYICMFCSCGHKIQHGDRSVGCELDVKGYIDLILSTRPLCKYKYHKDGFYDTASICLNLQHGNISENFRRWEQQVQLYIKSIGYGNKPKDEQAALILHCAGEDAIEVYNTFEWPEIEASGSSGSLSAPVVQPKDDPKEILKKFHDYCNPRKNVVYERFKFWTTRMADSFDNFITELRTKAKACDFMASDEMLRDKIVFSINDVHVQERLLREPELTLVKAINICKTAESSQKQLEVMQPGTQAVNAIARKSRNMRRKPDMQHSVNKQCKYCMGSHKKGKCPAYGKKCRSCGKLNHFSKACLSAKEVHHMEETGGNETMKQNFDSFFIGILDGVEDGNNDKWEVDLIIEDKNVHCKLDTGAEANVISSKMPNSLKISTMKSEPTMTKLRAYGGKIITPIGKVTLAVGKDKHKLTFHVIASNERTILGKSASEDLGYVKRMYVMVNKSSKEEILERYKDVFEGLGTFSKPYQIQLKTGAKAAIQATRIVPYPKQAKLKELLDKMTSQGIIADVDQPTDWVSNLVITEKSDGSMRICLDPKPLNEAIKREHHKLPTADDVHSKLANKKIFTIIDERHAFWQVPLTENSSYLCTFHTPWGRKRFLRMPFGICSVSEVMQKRNESILVIYKMFMS